MFPTLPAATSANITWTKLLSDLLNLGQETFPKNHIANELRGYQSRIDMGLCVVSNPLRRMPYHDLCSNLYSLAVGPTGQGFFKRQLGAILDDLKDNGTGQMWTVTTREFLDPSMMTWSVRTKDHELAIDCTAIMRSGNAWSDWPQDVFNFSMMSAFIAKRLHRRNVPVTLLGDLNLIVGSQYLKECDQGDAIQCVAQPRSTNYERFSLADYVDANDLLRHLGEYASDISDHRWMAELQSNRPPVAPWVTGDNVVNLFRPALVEPSVILAESEAS